MYPGRIQYTLTDDSNDCRWTWVSLVADSRELETDKTVCDA